MASGFGIILIGSKEITGLIIYPKDIIICGSEFPPENFDSGTDTNTDNNGNE